MNITDKTSKDEVISSAVELIDTQQEQLNTLHQQQKILFTAVGILTLISLL